MAANIPPTEQDFELLSAYLDNQLSARDRSQLEIRLAAEPALRAALDELQLTVAVLKAAPQIAVPRNFTLDVARYRRPLPWWARYQSMQLFGAIGTVASIVLIVIGAALFSTNQQSLAVPAAAKLSGSLDNSVALAPTDTATPQPTAVQADKQADEAALPTATIFVVPTLVPTHAAAENAAALPPATATSTGRYFAQSAPSGGAVAPVPQAAQSGAASSGQPPLVPQSTSRDLAQAQQAPAEGPLTETPLAKDQLSSTEPQTGETSTASDGIILKAATAQSTATVTATPSETPAPTITLVANVPTSAPPPAVSTVTTPLPTPALPVVLIGGIALLIFSIMLFAIGWLRSRLRG